MKEHIYVAIEAYKDVKEMITDDPILNKKLMKMNGVYLGICHYMNTVLFIDIYNKRFVQPIIHHEDFFKYSYIAPCHKYLTFTYCTEFLQFRIERLEHLLTKEESYLSLNI